MKKQTRQMIESYGPRYVNNNLVMGKQTGFQIHQIADGDYSLAQIVLEGHPVAYGVAKRHPGDARNPDLGMALALTRAFTDAATKYARTFERMMEPDQDIIGEASDRLAKQLRQSHQSMKQDAKDVKRKAARDAFRQMYGWDHTTHKIGEAVNKYLEEE